VVGINDLIPYLKSQAAHAQGTPLLEGPETEELKRL